MEGLEATAGPPLCTQLLHGEMAQCSGRQIIGLAILAWLLVCLLTMRREPNVDKSQAAGSGHGEQHEDATLIQELQRVVNSARRRETKIKRIMQEKAKRQQQWQTWEQHLKRTYSKERGQHHSAPNQLGDAGGTTCSGAGKDLSSSSDLQKSDPRGTLQHCVDGRGVQIVGWCRSLGRALQGCGPWKCQSQRAGRVVWVGLW